MSAQEELTARITEALGTHNGVLRPAIIALMAEAYAEGVQDIASQNALPEVETAKMLEDNPYRRQPKPEPVRPREEQPMWRGDREYLQAQWDHDRTPERYGGGLG